MVRVLIASGQFLAEVPTNEQGYPVATLGGCGWTWEEKQRVVSVCSDALYQIVSASVSSVKCELTNEGWGELYHLRNLCTY